MAQARPVALVTGATSGIGELAAAALAEAGFQVIGTGRDTSKTKARNGIAFIDLDVTSDQSVTEAMAQLISRFGRIDVLVNNAGMGSAGATEENSLDQDRRVFEVNVFGVLRMTKAVLPHMRAQGSGRIVNISSIFGLIPAPFMASYGAAKHAIEGYSESVDHEVREHGIRVIIVEPAGTRTKFDDNSAHPDIPLTAYSASRKTVAEVVATAVNEGDDPNLVAAAIVAAATDSKPRLRYPASPNARRLAMLRRLVPAGAFDKQIRKFNKLPVKTSVQPRQSESSIR
jgi:short-subunit dehydrogenase